MHANVVYFLCMGTFVLPPGRGQLHPIVNHEDGVGTEKQVKQLGRLLSRAELELHYDYIVVVKDVTKKTSCIFEESVSEVGKPMMVLCNLPEVQHSSNFLLVSCSLEYLNQLNPLNARYRDAPHMIWLETQADHYLCDRLHENGFFRNLIITPTSLSLENNYSRCDLQKQLQPVSGRLFVNPFLNMRGLPIITESDQLPPRSILSQDDFGRLKLSGFVANYVETFAQRHNATLIIVPPATLGVTVHYSELVKKTFQGLLDIAAVVSPFEMEAPSASYSYPVELMEYCYMVPLPHIRPAYNVYFDIIEVKAMLAILTYFVAFTLLLNIGQGRPIQPWNVLHILLDDKSIRGLLGQSFVMPRKSSFFLKYILFLVCYSSILLSTSYQAYLQSHLVHPSLERRMETFEDIRKNHIKILITDQESHFIPRATLEHNQDVFVEEKNFFTFLSLRDSMDTRYIYPVSQTRWSVFHERQKLFQRKLFFYSSQLCLNDLVPLAFPLRPGLPYKSQFNQHLLDVRDSGLLDCWLDDSFLNMVRLKLLSFEDLSVADEYGPQLDLTDLLWIWISFAICASLSALVFVLELIFHKIQRNK